MNHIEMSAFHMLMDLPSQMPHLGDLILNDSRATAIIRENMSAENER